MWVLNVEARDHGDATIVQKLKYDKNLGEKTHEEKIVD